VNQDQPLTFDGQQIGADAGAVTVVVQRVRVGAYRLSIRHAATGFEVDELSRSYASERAARRAARTATVLFRGGLTVIDALDMLAAFASSQTGEVTP
jgi:hypothetical protein